MTPPEAGLHWWKTLFFVNRLPSFSYSTWQSSVAGWSLGTHQNKYVNLNTSIFHFPLLCCSLALSPKAVFNVVYWSVGCKSWCIFPLVQSCLWYWTIWDHLAARSYTPPALDKPWTRTRMYLGHNPKLYTILFKMNHDISLGQFVKRASRRGLF